MTIDSSRPAPISEQIRTSLQSLPRAERQVGLVILANYPAAALNPVAIIASEAKVSGPTVLRFVRSIGYSSFPAFKEALRTEITANSRGPLGRERARTRPSASTINPALHGEIERILEAALLNADSIPTGEWEAMIALLADTTRPIYVTGGRFSVAVARDLALNLQLMRPRVQLLDDIEFRDQSVLLDMNRRSVFVIYDFMRYQKSVIRAAHSARENGATIVLFTDGELSPIRTDAQIVLPVSTEGFSSFSGMAVPTILTEIALGAVYEKLGESAQLQLSRWEILRSGEIIN